MLEGVRDCLLDRDEFYRSVYGSVEQCVRLESVELDGSSEPHEVLVLMRDLKRPECVFRWRTPAVEPSDFEETLRRLYSLKDAAKSHATVVWAGGEEDILAVGYGLPKECSPGVINGY